MATAEDVLGLGTQLLKIEEGKFKQVVGLLEHMHEHPEVQKTFSLIRSRLAEVKPRRRPTLKRLFCEPFEDLFEPAVPTERPPVDAIERLVLNRLWPIVEKRMGAEAVRDYAGRLKTAEGPELARLSGEVWAAGADAVTAISGELEAGRHAEEMGMRLNARRIRQIQDIGESLVVAPAIVALKAELSPKPLAKLHEDHLQGVQKIARTIAHARPEALRVLILVASSRLADPAMLLSSVWNMDLGQKSTDRAALFSDLSASVVGQIEERARTLKETRGAGADRLAVADLAVDLVGSLDATRSAMEMSRRGEFDHRLKAVRGAVHEMVRTQVLADAETGILAGMEDIAAGGAPDRDTLLRAENHARALRKCAVLADSLGLRTELKTVTDKTVGSLTGTAKRLLGTGSTPSSKAGYSAVRLIELIAGPSEANRILSDILGAPR